MARGWIGWLTGWLVALAGCHLLAGLDDYSRVTDSVDGGVGGTATGGAAGSGAAAGHGGAAGSGGAAGWSWRIGGQGSQYRPAIAWSTEGDGFAVICGFDGVGPIEIERLGAGGATSRDGGNTTGNLLVASFDAEGGLRAASVARGQVVQASVAYLGGKVWVAGSFTGTLTLEGLAPIASDGGTAQDGFVASYDPSTASALDLKHLETGGGPVDLTSLAVEAAGGGGDTSLVVGGSFKNALGFPPYASPPVGIEPDLFATWLTSAPLAADAGLHLPDEDGQDGVKSLDDLVLVEGTSFLAGSFAQTLRFSPSVVASVTGASDGYVAAYDANQVYVRHLLLTGVGGERYVRALAAAPPSLVVAGDYQGTIELPAQHSSGDRQLFVAGLGADLSYSWSYLPADDGGTQQVADLAVDADGLVWVVGTVAGPITFATEELGEPGASQMFVLALSNTGEYRWARLFDSLYSAQWEQVYGVAAPGEHTAILVGEHSGDLDFGHGQHSSNDTDVFVATVAAPDS